MLLVGKLNLLAGSAGEGARAPSNEEPPVGSDWVIGDLALFFFPIRPPCAKMRGEAGVPVP